MRYDLVVFVALAVIVLMVIHRKTQVKVRAERAQMFNACLSLFEDYELTQDRTYFPVLTGRYSGYDIKLEPIADHNTFRMIPSLWLLATVQRDVPFDGIFDFLVRPRNTEFYSPSSNLEIDIKIPEGWPQYATLKTNDPDRMPPQELLAPHMDIFEDPRTKELLVTPRGVRIVYQADAGVRAYYMVLRQCRFENLELTPELVGNLMEKAIAIHKDLSSKQPTVESKHHEALAQ